MQSIYDDVLGSEIIYYKRKFALIDKLGKIDNLLIFFSITKTNIIYNILINKINDKIFF